ncbi:AraC family transcriptional regulator [Paenibacillus allorhizosphaerae]|uniref:HTH-type transcriptional activator RhaS n=1 Tax=Paenibacillus allorhizosphaerae TaxID=2849866 RepID=A0ABN7TEC2_9BACL|nr:AraC family transcriptional regulator [Paenibacillus allorhizosphaerae]CAG7614790.1 HTH-type transcriptional activator RhaS [Paenibacillus allorhizosphaerae]
MELYTKSYYLESEEFPFSVLPFSNMPDRPSKPHTHDFIELVYVVNGCGEHVYKGRAYPISAGDIFVIPPFLEHDYRVTGSKPLDIYNVLFLPSLLTSELQTLSSVTPFVNFFYVEPFLRQNADFQSHMKLTPLEGQEVKRRLDRIATEFNQKALGYRISIKALLIELLVWLSRCYEERSVEPMFHASESKAIWQLCEYLDQHYDQQINLEQVCRMCGMSQTSFTAKFKQTVGKTFIEYRNEIRIHASLKWLRETDDKIIHVAERVGIQDLSYYNKLFKHYLGLTPREYRVKYRIPLSK